MVEYACAAILWQRYNIFRPYNRKTYHATLYRKIFLRVSTYQATLQKSKKGLSAYLKKFKARQKDVSSDLLYVFFNLFFQTRAILHCTVIIPIAPSK
jgi:hypothetical protein